MSRILFVVNAPQFFLSHRLPIALRALSEGHEVHVATAPGGEVDRILSYGFKHHSIDIERSGQNPIREFVLLIWLYKLFRNVRPDLVHLITIKPVIYGGIVARLARIPAVVAAVSGLGTVFLQKSKLGTVRRKLISALYRSAFRHRNLRVIFQNPDDRDTLLAALAVVPTQVRMIRGSGVDLSCYSAEAEPKGRPVVVMAARLLRDKGVLEFVEAARILRKRGVNTTMRLIGSVDRGNPSSVGELDLEQWRDEGVVEILGFRSDIADQYSAANVVCLPSYREGLPKGLVEAAACGRAVVTTDVPGCRDAITPGVTGLLVPVKNAEALADALQLLIESPCRRAQMGAAGRELAEEAFAIEKIVDQHMTIYGELLAHAR